MGVDWRDVQRRAASADGQALGHIDSLGPKILASWEAYAPRMLADSAFLGVKAANLLKLPRDWVPPFLVLTKTFTRLQSAFRSSKRAFENLQRDERDLLERFCDSVVRDSEFGNLILVRSNAADEDLSCRGTFQSFNSPPVIDELADRIDAVLRQRSDHMCVLLQRAVEPALLGHMSNERRVSSNKARWLVEGALPQSPVRHRFVRAAKGFGVGPQYAGTTTELLSCLQGFARFLVRTGTGYHHCEWVWNGKRVWLVQADDASQDDSSSQPSANRYLLGPQTRRRRLKQTFETLKHFRDVPGHKWRKLQRPLEFDRIGLPTADVYLLSGTLIAKGRSTALIEDLTQLCRLPVVVRCDIAEKVERADIFLPTSPPFSNADELINYLEILRVYFTSRGIPNDKWAALLAHLVPARASAMVHAHPKSPRIQIDALWGFPDGLNHFAHDTYFFYPDDNRVRTLRRFKGHCLLPDKSGWKDCSVGPPLDWRSVLSRLEIRLLAGWGSKLARALDQEVQLMALARIGGLRGLPGCIPWHYSTWQVPPYSESTEFLPAGVRVIATRDDLKVIERSNPADNWGGFLLQPNPELLRDADFIRDVAQVAAKLHKPLYFYGSLLGHAYYVMSKTGAVVIPITEGEPSQDRQTYRKLVRDRIPIVIREAGALARVRSVSKSEASRLLAQKLIEESYEVWSASESALTEELVDIIEVVDALRHQSGITDEEFARKRDEKRAQRGGFDELIFLEETNLRSLKAADVEPGRLPLFADSWGVGAPAPRRRSVLKAERSAHAADLARFSVPLIPPVDHGPIGDSFAANVGEFWVQAQYIGNRLNVVVRRRQPVESPNQLLLFPDLE